MGGTYHKAVPKGQVAKSLAQPGGVKPSLVVLADHPGLECGEEEGGGDAREEPPEHQNVVVVDLKEWVGGWVDRNIEENKAVRMRCCLLEWVGGWVGGRTYQLDEAGDGVKNSIDDAHLLAAEVVGEGTHIRAGDHGGEETAHVQQGDVAWGLEEERGGWVDRRRGRTNPIHTHTGAYLAQSHKRHTGRRNRVLESNR